MLKTQYKFHKLTPTILESQSSIYEKALDDAYNDFDIKNIALTGIYGSGKSSVWKTYRNNKEKEFNTWRNKRKNKLKNKWMNDSVINVSLSNFTDVYEDTLSNQSEKPTNTKPIEDQMINQILYQINKNKIPQSKYSIKHPKNRIQKFFQVVIIGLLLVGFTLLFYKQEFSSFLAGNSDYPTLSINPNLSILIIALAFLVFPVVRIAFWFVTRASIQITKFTFRWAEANIKEDDQGILDKDIRELVYLITASKVHTLVFEDLDRFNNIDIFTKIRELNFLVNTNSVNNIRFIYMLKDDIFLTKERTKFFDLIIPIVPVINSQNSKGQIQKLFDETMDKGTKPDTYILERVSIFIDDMRILISIRNEYEIYSKEIDSKDRILDPNKLFAILVLKNIFHQEFDNLQQDTGYIYSRFNKKEEELSIKVQELENKIKQKNEKILTLKRLVAKRKTDLMAQHAPSSISKVNPQDKSWKDLFFEWSQKPEESYTFKKYNSSIFTEKFQSFIKLYVSSEDYIRDLSELDNDLIEDDITIYESDLSQLIDEKERVRLSSLSQILQSKSKEQLYEFFTDEFEYVNIIEDHYFPLIRYLLLEGLVDETYWHYKGYFYSCSLGKNDEIFLRSLLDGTSQKPEFILDNPVAVILELKEEDFDRNSIFNISLMNQLISEQHSNYLFRMVRGILRQEKDSILIMHLSNIDYFNLEQFAKLLLPDHYDLLWKIIVKNTYLDMVNLKLLVALYSNENRLPENGISKLNEFTVANSKVLEIMESQKNDNFYNGLQNACIKFKEIFDINLTKEIAKIIEEKNIYELNLKNSIQLINTIIGGDETLNNKNLLSLIFNTDELSSMKSRISESFESFLIEYIDEAISQNIILSNSENQTVFILNSEISLEYKIKFLEVNDSVVTSLSEVKEPTIWPNIVSNDRLIFSEENLVSYWHEKPDDLQSIIHYLNAFYNHADSIRIPSDLADCLINDETICEQGFFNAIKTAEYQIEALNKDISDERIMKLIDEALINSNESNTLTLLEKRNTDLFLKFAECKGEGFLESILSDNVIASITQSLLEDIVSLNLFTAEETIQIIQKSTLSISLFKIEKAEISVRNFILNNAFYFEDLNLIVSNCLSFDLWDEFTTMLSAEYIKDLLKSIDLTKDFIDKVLVEKNIAIESQIQILLQAIRQGFPINLIESWINITPDIKPLSSVFHNKKPIIVNDNQKFIVEALVELGVVSISPKTNRINLIRNKYFKLKLEDKI